MEEENWLGVGSFEVYWGGFSGRGESWGGEWLHERTRILRPLKRTLLGAYSVEKERASTYGGGGARL
jgi:hypothetical protein